MQKSMKQLFVEQGIESLWVEYWDNLKEWVVMDICLKKAENLRSLDDLTPKEKTFIRMVDSWE